MNTYSEKKIYESYSNEVERMQKCIDELQQENKKYKEVIEKLENKIKELIKYGFGTDMSLGEFKEFYKLATGKDYDPKKCLEVE